MEQKPPLKRVWGVFTKEKSVFYTEFPRSAELLTKDAVLILALATLSLASAGRRTLTSLAGLNVNGLLVLSTCVCCSWLSPFSSLSMK